MFRRFRLGYGRADPAGKRDLGSTDLQSGYILHSEYIYKSSDKGHRPYTFVSQLSLPPAKDIEPFATFSITYKSCDEGDWRQTAIGIQLSHPSARGIQPFPSRISQDGSGR